MTADITITDAVCLGEWGAGLHRGEWHIIHVPSQTIYGVLPGRKLASVAHALRRLAAQGACPTKVAGRVSRLIGWELGMDDCPVAETHPAAVWVRHCGVALRSAQGPAWGYDPNEPPPETWEPMTTPRRPQAA
jgi:hypothetical protein